MVSQFVKSLASRGMLISVNGASLILGCVLIFYGVTGYVAMGREKSVGEVTNPFAIVISLGTLTLAISLLGLAGGFCSKSFESASETGFVRRMATRALLGYYTLLLLICAGLVYAMFLCFLFSEKANDYVLSYWTVIETVVGKDAEIDAVQNFLKDHSVAGGIISLVAIFLNLLCGHCSAVLMGYRYTTKRTMMVSNFLTCVVGIITIIIAFLPSTAEMGVANGWLPNAIGSMGVIVFLFSFMGFLGVWRELPIVLVVHCVLLSLIGIILFGFSVFALTNSRQAADLFSAQLPAIRESFLDICPDCGDPTNTTQADNECCSLRAGIIVWNNMTILGVTGAILFIALLLNLFGSIYMHRQIRREEKDTAESGVVDCLQDDEALGGGGRTAKKKYNVDNPSDDL